MAPVKPMGADQKNHGDTNPKTKPGVTGFPQKYNEAPGPVNDLNPDVVTENSVLPTPDSTAVTTPTPKKVSTRRAKK